MIKKLSVVLRSSRFDKLTILETGHKRIPHAGEHQKVPPSWGVEIDLMFVGRSISTTLAALPSHMIVFMAFSLDE